MKFVKIDMDTWKRIETFKHFSSDVPCTYSVSINIDITNTIKQVRERKLKFFPVILYGISCIVNTHQEFRMSKDSSGDFGYYEVTNPCFTVFHDDMENFTNVWTEYRRDFRLFYKNYLEDMNIYEKSNDSKPLKGNNLFSVSCIPWVSFSGFNLNLQRGYDHYLPIFTIGRYFADSTRVLLPLAIQVHHAVCYGFHVARFINELQEWANGFVL
mgnify:CR=1 FL=1